LYLAISNWCDVYDKGFVLKRTLNKHKESNAYEKRLDHERNIKKPPSNPRSNVENLYNYDEGNKVSFSSLITNNLKAFNKGLKT